MNTKASVAYGWGILIVAGAGSYYFAKRSINSDRAERAAAEEKRRQQRELLRAQEIAARESRESLSSGAANVKRPQVAAAVAEEVSTEPSHAVQGDPAPVGHAQDVTRGKYEAADPFRSRKGDRFS